MLLAGILLVLSCGSCASYSSRLRNLRRTVQGGQLEDALEQVSGVSESGDLLYHLERGSLQHYAGRHAESNAEFARAEELIEDLYTISISQRALTFALNDEVEAYRGELHEANYLHYYRVLNYLALGERQEAAVEARRLALRLAEARDQHAADPLMGDDPFLEFLVGAVLESVGDFNDALIAYRHAATAQRDWESEAGLPPLPWIEEDLLRMARMAGIPPEAVPELADIDPAVRIAHGGGTAGDEGRILLFFESGWTPMKESVHLRVPIFRDDPEWGDQEGALDAGFVLAERYRNRRVSGRWDEPRHKVDYFLDVAVPALAAEQGGCASSCSARIRPVGVFGPGAAPVEVLRETVPAADLARHVEHAFARKEVSIWAKTFARALLKYAAQRTAKKDLGAVAGVLANLAGVATEKADTRSWLLLPGEIQIASLRVEPGQYQLVLEAYGPGGRRWGSDLRTLEIAPGGLAIASWRVFD
jgi:hypothetical protein